ncbi:MAG: hypothetical protein GTO18_05975 [Anaerolineales bacterium]|nr:hypothetical protein [Anaerolineales bacterium]
MTEDIERPIRSDPSFRPLMRSLAIELAIYAPLVTIYFFVVIRFLKEPLVRLYQENLTVYAIATLVVIVIQGVLLEMLTSWLLRRIGLR